MIQKPYGYDTAPIYGTGDLERVTPGGHICQIRGVKVEPDPRSGERIMKVAFDLAPQDAQAGIYQRIFGARQQSVGVDAQWPAVYRQNLDGKGTPYFKGFITSVEKSNAGYAWNWDETTLKGKLFGGVFRVEEFRGTDGNIHETVRISAVRSIDTVLDAAVPDPKRLSDNGASAAAYAPDQSAAAQEQLPF